MTWTLSINGTDLSGLTPPILLNGIPPWDDSPVSSRVSQTAAGRTLGVRSRLDTVGPRALTIPLLINAFNPTDKQAGLDWIKQWVRQEITFRRDDGTTARELIATVLNSPWSPIAVPGGTAMAGGLVLDGENPLWRATSDTTTSGIGSSPVTLALGNAPSEGYALDITVSGGSDPRTITVTIVSGGVTYVCTWTGTIGGNTLHVNATLSTVLNNVTNAISAWVGGFPPLDSSGGGCTMAVSSSSGTATATLTHRKQYF